MHRCLYSSLLLLITSVVVTSLGRVWVSVKSRFHASAKVWYSSSLFLEAWTGGSCSICNININIPNIWTCFIEHSFSVPFLFSQPSWLVLYGPTKSQQKDTYVLKWIRSWSWINLQVKWLDAPPAFVSWMILTLSLTAVLCVDIPNWLI